jgi:hypothetical protein
LLFDRKYEINDKLYKQACRKVIHDIELTFDSPVILRLVGRFALDW